MGTPTKTATSTGLTTTLGGSAIAVGDSTLVTGTITNTATDVGPVTRSSGTSTFTASAQSSDWETTYASAYTYADVDGEDLLITITRHSTDTNHSGGQTTMSATSNTFLFALDIEGLDLPIGTITVGPKAEHGGPSDAAMLNGNAATFDLFASAAGEDTWVDTELSLVATDGVSTVDAFAVTVA